MIPKTKSQLMAKAGHIVSLRLTTAEYLRVQEVAKHLNPNSPKIAEAVHHLMLAGCHALAGAKP